jgi:hypothetical protein
VASIALAGGCSSSDKPIKVAGTIKWSDGTPVDGAVVVFVSTKEGGREANGFTADDGSFELTSFSFGDGAVPGEYKVLVSRAELLKKTNVVEGESLADKMKNWSNAKKRESSPSAQPKDRDAIPLVYTKAESTPLRWTVSAGNTTPELKIQRRK